MGTFPPFPPYSFMACTDTTLSSYFAPIANTAGVYYNNTGCVHNKSNTEAPSHKQYCDANLVSISYFKCVPTALSIQLAKRMRRITLSSVTCLAELCFFYISL